MYFMENTSDDVGCYSEIKGMICYLYFIELPNNVVISDTRDTGTYLYIIFLSNWAYFVRSNEFVGFSLKINCFRT